MLTVASTTNYFSNNEKGVLHIGVHIHKRYLR